MRRLLLVIVLFALPAAAAERKGFVWASQPSVAQYTATDQYAYNSAGGAVTIARDAPGSYAVTFPQLARGASGGGNVQVAAYGGRPQTCGVAGWTGAENLVVRVRCFALGTGEPSDSRFSLLVTWAPEPRMVVLQQSAVGAATTGAATTTEAVQTSISAEGYIVKRYADRIETHGAGFIHTKYLDGRPDRTISFNTGAPASIPPTSPDNAERNWLTWHSDALLAMIKSLVGNNQSSIDNYVESEPTNLTIYDRINRRRETINLLLD